MPRAEDLYAGETITYGRTGATVHRELEARLCDLETGVRCVLFPSGLSACAATVLALCASGDHVLVTDSVYGPTRRALFKTAKRFGITAEAYDPRLGGDIGRLMRPQTRAIIAESPGSLTFEIQDLPALAAAAHTHGAALVVDNTWASGIALKPLTLGADISVIAATKFLSGASDTFLGAAVASTSQMGDKLSAYARELGLSTSPDDVARILRSLPNLPARYAAQAASARDLAHWLSAQPHVASVLHPALSDHPDHALWRRDFIGADAGDPSAGGSVFGVITRTHDLERVHSFLNALNTFGLGFSYGGFESLAVHCDPQIRRTVTPWRAEGVLIRLAIGLEPLDQLQADLQGALAHLG